MKHIDKVWGFEEIIVNNELYCAKYLVIKKGYQTSIHYHEKKDETFLVVEGAVELMIGIDVDIDVSLPETIRLKPGESYRIRPREKHRVRAREEDVTILEISTHHEDSDSKRLQIGGKIPQN